MRVLPLKTWTPNTRDAQIYKNGIMGCIITKIPLWAENVGETLKWRGNDMDRHGND